MLKTWHSASLSLLQEEAGLRNHLWYLSVLFIDPFKDGHCLSHSHIHWFISRFHLQWKFINNKILDIIGVVTFESFLKMLNKYYIFLNIFFHFVYKHSFVVWSSLLQFHIEAIQIGVKIFIRFKIRILNSWFSTSVAASWRSDSKLWYKCLSRCLVYYHLATS